MSIKKQLKTKIEELRFFESSDEAWAVLRELENYLDTLKEQPVCEELEEEVEAWTKGNPALENEPCPAGLFNDCIVVTARHFAKWQKEQMMKETVEGWVSRDLNGCLYFHAEEPYYDGIDDCWMSDEYLELPEKMFPEIEHISKPVKVKLILVKDK